MSQDLLQAVQEYQPQKIELWERKSLVLTHSFQGTDSLNSIQEKGIQLLLSHILEHQKLILFGERTTITLAHKGTNYSVSLQRKDEESWVISLPISKRISLPAPDIVKQKNPIEPLHHDPNTIQDQEKSDNLVETSIVQKKSPSFGAGFAQKFGVHDAYVAGAMAGGIASVELVQAMSSHGRLAFFGAGGLPVDVVDAALKELSLLNTPFGCNLLCNVQQPQEEERMVDVLLENKITLISASAYAQLTPAIIRYRLVGIHTEIDGSVVVPNRIIAKVSHPSVAQLFLSPPSKKIVAYLHKQGKISAQEAALAHRIGMADALTVEADSGGHTDNRQLSVILPSIKKLASQSGFSIFVGAAGGLGTPQAMASAVVLGADFLVVGSVHQSCTQAGTSALVKQMLCRARITDTDMGIAPDMFERGAKVQVLTAGSRYATNSRKLRELYLRYASFEEIPQAEQKKLIRLIFRDSYEHIWGQTVAYWKQHDPKQLERAARIPKHKLALLFRWYLGQSSRWARMGVVERKQDFQVWCGPSMGAFNEWAREHGFEEPESRSILDVSDALWNQLTKLL